MISIQNLKGLGLAAIILNFLCSTSSVIGAELDMEKSMPAPACSEGWIMDGTVTLYDKDTLFDRIDGESELYFPYGFDKLAYARYVNKQNPQVAIDADVYRMGSFLDAFGMFANYRKKEDADIALGAEGTVSTSQLFFYQDRFFVRLQATGTTSMNRDIFLSCARAISRNLPKTAGRPKELDLFMIPGVNKKSERYVAQSLLGYDFFHRGIIADATLNNALIQVFIVIEGSPEIARKTIEQYRVYLKTAGRETRQDEPHGLNFVEANDPLYGKVIVEQAGSYVIGAVRIADSNRTKQLLNELRRRIGRE